MSRRCLTMAGTPEVPAPFCRGLGKIEVLIDPKVHSDDEAFMWSTPARGTKSLYGLQNGSRTRACVSQRVPCATSSLPPHNSIRCVLYVL
jgi:hypothetical protein